MSQIKPSTETPKYRRVVLKISGEGFTHPGERGIAMDAVLHIARQTYSAAQHGVRIAIVIGGGNILRGAQFTSGNSCVNEATAHYMGMLATMINGLALQDALESLGCDTRLMTAVRTDGVAEPYIRRRARRHLEKGRIVILAGGTGSPFVTTDTAAAQRALELEAEILLKATRVDGVFSDDPEKNPHAVLYSELSYDDFRRQNLRVMDHEAITKCAEYNMPIPAEVARYKCWQRRRLSMRPGLTCLWQVSGRNKLDFNKWMELDLKYLDNWSLLLDLKIMIRTVPVVLFGIGAY